MAFGQAGAPRFPNQVLESNDAAVACCSSFLVEVFAGGAVINDFKYYDTGGGVHPSSWGSYTHPNTVRITHIFNLFGKFESDPILPPPPGEEAAGTTEMILFRKASPSLNKCVA